MARFHRGAQELRDFLAEFCHIAPEQFSDHLYTYHDEAAIRHLFRVAAGLDSMVVGESEILGQVRSAYSLAAEEGVAGAALGDAFRWALHTGKSARADSAGGHRPKSIASAAVELARGGASNGSLAGSRLLIIGAGKMGGLSMRSLGEEGVRSITVLNRTEGRARALSDVYGAVARPMEELEDALGGADVVICSATSATTVIEPDMVARVMTRRTSSPLLIIDIAVPRGVDPAVGGIDGVVVRDLDDLGALAEKDTGGRVEELAEVERIVDEELERFGRRQRSRRAAPSVSALVARADEIRRAELDRMSSRLQTLSPEQQDAVDHLTRRLVAKLLHDPIARAKALAGSERGRHHLDALVELLDLDAEEL